MGEGQNESSHRATRDGFLDEIMRVEASPAQGDEEITGLQRARIGDDGSDDLLRIARNNATRDGCRQPPDRET